LKESNREERVAHTVIVGFPWCVCVRELPEAEKRASGKKKGAHLGLRKMHTPPPTIQSGNTL
jgi:hypothetical protein